MKSHITIGTNQDDQSLVDLVKSGHQISWPVPSSAEIGDIVYLLIPSLTGSIIAKGTVSTTPIKSINWQKKYESVLENILFSVNQPCIEFIAKNIPKWEYPKYARSYTTIPDEHLGKFVSIVGDFDNKPRLYREVLKEEIINALENNLFSEIEIKMLSYFLSAPSNELNAIQLASLLGYPRFNPVNAIIGSIGKKISERYMIHPDWWTPEEPNWWSVIATGWRDGYFFWQLKPQIVEALKNASLPIEDGLEYETDEVVTISEGNEEGGRINVLVSIYERDAANRKACLAFHGCKCSICSFDFGKAYGKIGKGYIQVHHIIPLNEMKTIVKVNPKTDLVPLCANCHAMIHRKKPAYALSEIKSEMNIEE